jgi:hypothetical protein
MKECNETFTRRYLREEVARKLEQT